MLEELKPTYSRTQKGGQSMKQFYIALLALVIGLCGVGFRLTHHPIYKHCSWQADGYVCKLVKWEGNK
jgi:hypothetical protein